MALLSLKLSVLTIFLYTLNHMIENHITFCPVWGDLFLSLFRVLSTAQRFRTGRLPTATPRTDWPPN